MITQVLSRYTANISYDDLPPEVVEQFRKAFMDYLASALAGSMTEGPQKIMGCFAKTDKGDQISAIGIGKKLSLPNAVFINGVSGHALDMDDGHRKGALHPAVAIFPAVMGLVESRPEITYEDVVAATVAAYDVMTRVSMGGHPATRYRGFHNTAISGVFGATAAACRLLKFNEEQVTNAFGLAGSFASGLFAFLQNGADTKKIHPGKSARDGVLCAELTEYGLLGPNEIFEGKDGFYSSFAGEMDPEKVLTDLGKEYEIMNLYFKPFPCCRHIHSAMDAVISLKEDQDFDMDAIEKIWVGTYEVASRHNHTRCTNRLEAQMGIPYAVSVALCYDKIGLNEFTPTDEIRSHVKPYMDKVVIEVDEDCEKEYPKTRPTAVELFMKNGKTLRAKVDKPWGDKNNPMSLKDTEEKFLDASIPVLGEERSLRIADLMKKTKSVKEIRELIGLAAKVE